MGGGELAVELVKFLGVLASCGVLARLAFVVLTDWMSGPVEDE